MPAVSTQLNDFIMPAAPARRTPPGQGWFARLLRRVQDAHARQAERQIALLIERKGGRLTDDLERQIERHFI
jgi:hypothetical protein